MDEDRFYKALKIMTSCSSYKSGKCMELKGNTIRECKGKCNYFKNKMK